MVILIADDDMDARESLRVLLEIEGHGVLEATNGREAVEIAAGMRPDLILMDLNMPDMDGLTAIRTLRANSSTSDIRIIVISGDVSDPEWKRRATECGCDDWFVKPVDFQSLRHALHQPTS
jgi:CheY-like chemotaxis protein